MTGCVLGTDYQSRRHADRTVAQSRICDPVTVVTVRA